MNESNPMPTDFSTLLYQRLEPIWTEFTSPQSRGFWIYLSAALLLAILQLFRQSSFNELPIRERCGTFVRYCFPWKVLSHRSAKVDYVYFVVNKILFASLFTPLVAISVYTSTLSYFALELTLGPPDRAVTQSGLTTLIFYSACVVVAFDFGAFIAHYLQHRFHWLWEFHKVHHSAEVLTPITVYRVHPVDDLLNSLLPPLFTGLVDGVFIYISPHAPIWGVTVYHLNVFLFFFYLVGFNLRHSHVWVSYGPVVSQLLISPAQHQIHHSSDLRHRDKNLGFIFAFWDRLFGSLYVPVAYEKLRFGLGDREEEEYSSVSRLYLLPFKKLLKACRTPVGEKPAIDDK